MSIDQFHIYILHLLSDTVYLTFKLKNDETL